MTINSNPVTNLLFSNVQYEAMYDLKLLDVSTLYYKDDMCCRYSLCYECFESAGLWQILMVHKKTGTQY